MVIGKPISKLSLKHRLDSEMPLLLPAKPPAYEPSVEKQSNLKMLMKSKSRKGNLLYLMLFNCVIERVFV